MDYTQLSDFEINIAVFEALHNGSPDCKEGDNGAMVLISFEAGVVGGEVVEFEAERGAFNPCNKADDAWPIIIQNSIGVIPYKKGLSEAWNTATGLINGTTKDANPLRAAMIVFLMMQESKNANS
ncbi:TPA: DUF2591 family protein [Salmonella enterica]|nr:DUF2591 family protein [Salmonella enterica subsp. enterica serovar Schwarzengrund]HCC0777839.1 DUF2591 family protein [Salmonella enterica]HCJ3983861.1 DUF2591 family protein [Salmonella enterica]